MRIGWVTYPVGETGRDGEEGGPRGLGEVDWGGDVQTNWGGPRGGGGGGGCIIFDQTPKSSSPPPPPPITAIITP